MSGFFEWLRGVRIGRDKFLPLIALGLCAVLTVIFIIYFLWQMLIAIFLVLVVMSVIWYSRNRR